jgi:hypothetical protein
MFNICPQCGAYTEKKTVDPRGPFAICPECGNAQRFERLPLFALTGASGVGKSTIGLALAQAQRDVIIMECDILWRPEFNTPEDGYRDYRNTWLRLAKNIGQAGRPVALVGSAIPEQFETCPERRYFSAIHYLALVCDDDALVARLKARPDWRRSGSEPFVNEMLRFNRWLRAHAATTKPAMTLLETTQSLVESSVASALDWMSRYWPQPNSHDEEC